MGRFDLSFKSLAETCPLTLLRLFAPSRVDEGTRVEQVERELAMNLKSIDHAFRLFRNGERWVEHFEAELVISADDLLHILRRGVSLWLKYNLAVWTTIVLLSRRHAAAIPDLVRDDLGSYGMCMSPAVVRLWEVSPDSLLEDDSLDGLPVVGAMNSTPEAMDQVVARLGRVEDRETRSRLSAELVTWSSLKYNRDEVKDIRARLGMVTTKEVLMASPIGEEIMEYGKQEGRLAEARRSLQIFADTRFPELLDPTLAINLSDLGAIEAMMRAIAAAPDADHARASVSRLLGRA